jgi:hypothetical protein
MKLKPFLTWVLLLAQLALLVVVVKRFHVFERECQFPDLFPILVVGFVVNAILPKGVRWIWFVVLTCITALVYLEPALGLPTLLLCAPVLILTTIRINYWLKVMLLAGLGVLYVLLRSGSIPMMDGDTILACVGGIFMFRLIYLLHYERHQRFPVSTRLSYFLIPPNVFFQLFPIIDPKEFHQGYYRSQPLPVYYKGVRLITLGIIQTLVFRWVYGYLLPYTGDITTVLDLVLYAALTYVLVLRAVAFFHVALGILALFGYDLPPMFNYFFFATGFGDLWRRINIYWKDFMVKVIYYPVYFRIKSMGPQAAAVVSTLVVFVATWLLHVWQLFWISGDFVFVWRDVIFWGAFAIAVAAAVWWHMRRQPGRPSDTRWKHLRRAIQGVAMLLVMSGLWLYWVKTPQQWSALMAIPVEWNGVALVGAVAAAVAVGTLVSWLSGAALVRQLLGGRHPSSKWIVLGALVALAVMAHPQVGMWIKTTYPGLVQPTLNRADQELLEEGYYERVLPSTDLTSPVRELQQEQQDMWAGIKSSEAMRQVRDLRGFVLRPNVDMLYKGARLTTNSHGLRDKEYSVVKPVDTWRIAIVGSSIEMGEGVRTEETFEALTEDALNQRYGNRFESINFAASGYQHAQALMVLDSVVLPYQPDIAILFGHSEEMSRLAKHISLPVYTNVPIPYTELDSVIRAVVPDASTSSIQEIMLRLRSHRHELLSACLNRFAATCRAHGIMPVYAFVPLTIEAGRMDSEAELLKLAEAAGFTVIDLSTAYAGYDPQDLILSDWDRHPNTHGHQALADLFLQELLKRPKLLGLDN